MHTMVSNVTARQQLVSVVHPNAFFSFLLLNIVCLFIAGQSLSITMNKFAS